MVEDLIFISFAIRFITDIPAETPESEVKEKVGLLSDVEHCRF